MKAFIYNGELYLRCIPGKQLFRSTMVHEVVNRGDIFALRVSDQLFTVIPGKAEVEHLEVSIFLQGEQVAQVESSNERAEKARAKLRAISLELHSGSATIAEATRAAAGKQPGLFDGEVA